MTARRDLGPPLYCAPCWDTAERVLRTLASFPGCRVGTRAFPEAQAFVAARLHEGCRSAQREA